jgi:hypothetical protein
MEIITLGTNNNKKNPVRYCSFENPLKYIPIRTKNITPYFENS